MEELFNLGISENTIKAMLEINPSLGDLTKEEIIEKKKILEYVGCDETEILNIISSNALYLNRTNDEILKLIDYMKSVGFKNIDILLDSNPYILNLEEFEIKNYIKDRKDNGEALEDIVDDLDSDPYLFNEL